MKKHILLCCLLFCVACSPFKVTKQYYEDYVNPKPAIDYEDTFPTDLPQEFLEDYYKIDRKIVRVAEQIDIVDSHLDAAWIQQTKAANPWVRHIAVMDDKMLYVSGDEDLGFDSTVREALADRVGETGRFCATVGDRVLLVLVSDVGNGQLRVALVEMDVPLLVMEIAGRGTSLFTGERVYGPAATVSAEALSDITESTSYSGESNVAGTDMYWVRSMASNNLVYLYSN
jgi:hypothetical protein